jgi:hypothetical protein
MPEVSFKKANLAGFQCIAYKSGVVATPASPSAPARASGEISKKDMAVCMVLDVLPSGKVDEPISWALACILKPMHKKRYKQQRIL